MQGIQHGNIRRNTKPSVKTCTDSCQDNPKKALLCHHNSTGFGTLCIAKAAVSSHLSKNDQDHCGECDDIDYCGEPPVGSAECNRDTGTWTVSKVWRNWTHPTKLTASDPGYMDLMGYSVATSGNQVFASSPDNDNVYGSVYVFDLNQSSGSWTEKEKLVAGDRADGVTAGFGHSLAVSGDILVIGSHHPTVQDGSVYVFEKDPSTGDWKETAKLTASDGAPSFGYSVGIDGNSYYCGG